MFTCDFRLIVQTTNSVIHCNAIKEEGNHYQLFDAHNGVKYIDADDFQSVVYKPHQAEVTVSKVSGFIAIAYAHTHTRNEFYAYLDSERLYLDDVMYEDGFFDDFTHESKAIFCNIATGYNLYNEAPAEVIWN